jgi:aminoglycoside phosphotransferase (APT) family kinase protein
LSGEDAATSDVADVRRLATDLARFVAALGRVDATGGPAPGEHNVFRGEPLVRRHAATRSAIAALGGSIDVEAATSAGNRRSVHLPGSTRRCGSTATSTHEICCSNADG